MLCSTTRHNATAWSTRWSRSTERWDPSIAMSLDRGRRRRRCHAPLPEWTWGITSALVGNEVDLPPHDAGFPEFAFEVGGFRANSLVSQYSVGDRVLLSMVVSGGACSRMPPTEGSRPVVGSSGDRGRGRTAGDEGARIAVRRSVRRHRGPRALSSDDHSVGVSDGDSALT